MVGPVKQIVFGEGFDRRGFLRCKGWAGMGMLGSVSGGVLSWRAFGADAPAAGAAAAAADFSFVQVSDSHIGFGKEPNKDVVATFRTAVERINALPVRPDLLLHTGDLTHLSKPAEFDTVAQVLKGA